MREALLFYFNLKKSAAASNRIECLWRQCFIGNNVQRLVSPVQCQFWPKWQEARKSAQEGWELSIAGSFGRGRYPQSQKMFAEQFLKQPFPCGYMPWGRFKRLENGCRMNWTIDRWSDAKTHAKFCLPEKKRKSFLHRIVIGDEKWIYFQNPKRKKSWVDSPQSSTSSSRPSLRTEDDAVRLMGSGGCHLLRAVKTVSRQSHHRTRQQWSKTTWRHSTGKCYPIPLTHQTWHLLSITCFRHALAERHFDSYEEVRKWLDK